MDAASNCIVGWALSLNPNSDTIVEALTTGIGHTVGSPFYGTPMMLYIDNGKDYRCKRLEGTHLSQYELGRLNVDFEQQNALLETLGIGVTHAIPYRAWSKTIERVFGTIETQWIRELPGWCGNATGINRSALSTLANHGAANLTPTALAKLDAWLNEYEERMGSAEPAVSPETAIGTEKSGSLCCSARRITRQPLDFVIRSSRAGRLA